MNVCCDVDQLIVNIATTSTPVSISRPIISNGSQLDAGSLIQAERNKKAFRIIQKKIVRARSTLDWSQSNNIFCCSMPDER